MGEVLTAWGAVELVPLGETLPVMHSLVLPLLLGVGERERVGETVTLGLPLGLPDTEGLAEIELQPLGDWERLAVRETLMLCVSLTVTLTVEEAEGQEDTEGVMEVEAETLLQVEAEAVRVPMT